MGKKRSRESSHMRTICKNLGTRPICLIGPAALAIVAGGLAGTASAGTGEAMCSTAKSSKTEVTHEKAAEIGKPAPDFELTDLSGRKVRLSDFKGNIVVLEWFNPDCPFVNLAHNRSLSLKEKAKQYRKKGVVWLAVNSNGPGKQGHGKAVNKEGKQRFKMDYPVLLDPQGAVGRAYGAKRTPHMFVIDTSGKLVYDGAVDNTRGGDPEDADPPPPKNYVDAVLSALLNKDIPVVHKTEPWGCSVKYVE